MCRGWIEGGLPMAQTAITRQKAIMYLPLSCECQASVTGGESKEGGTDEDGKAPGREER
jgi:hypothetical protein